MLDETWLKSMRICIDYEAGKAWRRGEEDGVYVEIPLYRAKGSKLMCVPVCDPVGWKEFRCREHNGELGSTWIRHHKYFLKNQIELHE